MEPKNITVRHSCNFWNKYFHIVIYLYEINGEKLYIFEFLSPGELIRLQFHKKIK